MKKKKVELIETKSRMIVAMGWYGEMGDVDQRVQISFEMNKLWESNVQCGDVVGFRRATLCLFSFCLVHRPLSFDYNTSAWGELLSLLSVHVLLRF